MATKKKPLVAFPVPTFAGGYNSYTASKTNLKDTEIPYGQNVRLDDNGSITKIDGGSHFGPEVATGKAITGLGWLKNPTYNIVLASAGTHIYSVSTGTVTALTGVTLSDGYPTDFCQAADRVYIANGVDNLCYTDNGTTLTNQSNGLTGRWPVAFNQRLYLVSASNPDRIYYSNPYSYSASSPAFDLSNFGTFNTDLSASPKKNAGFLMLLPGAGVQITRLMLDTSPSGDCLYAFTKMHGVWKIVPADVNADGSINHTISQVITYSGSPAGRSVVKNGNDLWFYGGDGYYSLGEVAQYQSIRRSTKSGRVRSELLTIASAGKDDVAAIVYEEQVLIAYSTGTYNNQIIRYDNRLNAWSPPSVGLNVSCFLEWEDANGTHHLLAGSANSADSYLYDLESGTSINGSPISSFFETKSFDCGQPGLTKRFAFIDVFYAMFFGSLTYEVFLDEVLSLTGSVQLGNSSSKPSGLGSLPLGSFILGNEYSPSGTFATLQQNSQFRIDCGYQSGKNISVRFTNATTGEQFKVDSLTIYYMPGSIYES